MTGPWHVLVVDDEPPALEELRFLLSQESLVGEISVAGSIAAALVATEVRAPDIAFLDIELPDGQGLQLARTLLETWPTLAVIFVTAYEQHAVDAFGIDAVDYVLKPIRSDRVAQALRKAALALRTREPDRPTGPAVPTRIAVEVGGRTLMIDRAEVTVVEASRDYVRLHTAERSYLVRTPISIIEADWADAGYIRVHRSYIVSVAAVRELRADDSGASLLVGNLEVPVSRTYARDLKQRLLLGGST
jgi:DNA-binding LytR/AlgR family response regulator